MLCLFLLSPLGGCGKDYTVIDFVEDAAAAGKTTREQSELIENCTRQDLRALAAFMAELLDAAVSDESRPLTRTVKLPGGERVDVVIDGLSAFG